MNNSERALELFENYNCAQSVFAALSEELDIQFEDALKISNGFGGGMTKAEVCGAVSGACLAISYKHGMKNRTDFEGKNYCMRVVNTFMERFINKHGSSRCKGLLGYDKSTREGYEKVMKLGIGEKLCPLFVKSAVEYTEKLLVLNIR